MFVFCQSLCFFSVFSTQSYYTYLWSIFHVYFSPTLHSQSNSVVRVGFLLPFEFPEVNDCLASWPLPHLWLILPVSFMVPSLPHRSLQTFFSPGLNWLFTSLWVPLPILFSASGRLPGPCVSFGLSFVGWLSCLAGAFLRLSENKGLVADRRLVMAASVFWFRWEAALSWACRPPKPLPSPPCRWMHYPPWRIPYLPHF